MTSVAKYRGHTITFSNMHAVSSKNKSLSGETKALNLRYALAANGPGVTPPGAKTPPKFAIVAGDFNIKVPAVITNTLLQSSTRWGMIQPRAAVPQDDYIFFRGFKSAPLVNEVIRYRAPHTSVQACLEFDPEPTPRDVSDKKVEVVARAMWRLGEAEATVQQHFDSVVSELSRQQAGVRGGAIAPAAASAAATASTEIPAHLLQPALPPRVSASASASAAAPASTEIPAHLLQPALKPRIRTQACEPPPPPPPQGAVPMGGGAIPPATQQRQQKRTVFEISADEAKTEEEDSSAMDEQSPTSSAGSDGVSYVSGAQEVSSPTSPAGSDGVPYVEIVDDQSMGQKEPAPQVVVDIGGEVAPASAARDTSESMASRPDFSPTPSPEEAEQEMAEEQATAERLGAMAPGVPIFPWRTRRSDQDSNVLEMATLFESVRPTMIHLGSGKSYMCRARVCVHICACSCLCVCFRESVFVSAFVRLRLCLCSCLHLCLCPRVGSYACVCMCVYVCPHVCLCECLCERLHVSLCVVCVCA